MENYTSTKYSSPRAYAVKQKYDSSVELLRQATAQSDFVAIEHLIGELESLKVEIDYICRM
jgi:hypothetical protein